MIYAVLRRHGLNRLKTRSVEKTMHYEWPCPGDLIHLRHQQARAHWARGGERVHGRGPGMHVKRLGWDYVHLAIDDHSRLAYRRDPS